MTRKQLKRMAQELADLERRLQNTEDPDARAKFEKKIMQINDSADLTVDEMIELDAMIQEFLTN